ncbi:GntR family transcriptional regulator [Bacteroidales bacterium OttesenSCG-928-B11]|nr:GntR family transcriptional regulator [Bacteroidales bacterium OttesenSCG-928-E04]MDL2308032.1 GntR family transcriptional regulator [Bacteroidales bacterium OttesenSCG-928-C03]MDL2313284.1 GntR family transcriptional regulator [Bacteroidales bacterium OttesenSCG-928-B11]MDL2325490.1 GntR family transcriptional regulator [Bacteroidales bacterium OttesenSCG-928-A14]
MIFNDQQPIYLQIADYVCEQVLARKWQEGSRAPSVRELGVSLEVNPNTVLRSYDFLQNLEIINNKRGVGYFIQEDAVAKIIVFKKERFFDDELPPIFRTMDLLDINMNEVESAYRNYKQQQ